MNCLKCGREISEDEVFCVECRLDGQRYPVPPAAAVYIPKRSQPEAPKKAPRRRSLTPEEQIQQLRRRLRISTCAALLFACLAGGLISPAFAHWTEEHHQKGQNYRPIVSATAPAAAAVTETTTAAEAAK